MEIGRPMSRPQPDQLFLGSVGFGHQLFPPWSVHGLGQEGVLDFPRENFYTMWNRIKYYAPKFGGSIVSVRFSASGHWMQIAVSIGNDGSGAI